VRRRVDSTLMAPLLETTSADFLLGVAKNYQELAVQDSGHWNNVSWAAYVQDNWRVNRKLTLNLGLRWDGVARHTYEANNRMGNFYPSLYNPADAATLLADGSHQPEQPGTRAAVESNSGRAFRST